MTKIALRDYLAGIDELIEERKFVEAIAHCRHVLRRYPKNIATYRLLGKAHLEEKRYDDALDIFQRVLSSIPDDFVSHVGMSLVREAENNQDAAISHMERAFEAQPSNRAVQDELRRLYGKREGFTPPKVRLTRPALARMYSHGDLYNQAISELRGAISEDGPRPELLVLLAEMYMKVGQEDEALQTADQLLEQLPYCLYAAQLKAEIHSRRNQLMEAKQETDRVAELDPYQALAAFDESPETVPAEEVMIEHLILHTGELELEEIPRAWTGALDPLLADGPDAPPEELPDWLSLPEDEEEAAQPEVAPPLSTSELKALQELEPQGTGNLESTGALPSWMEELEEDEASSDQSAEAEGSISPFGEADEEAAPVAADAESSEPEETDDDDLAWLESLAASQGTDEAELVTDAETRDEAHPDFLPDDEPQEVPSDKRSLTWWLDELEEAENIQAFDRSDEMAAGNEGESSQASEEDPQEKLEPGGIDTKQFSDQDDAEPIAEHLTHEAVSDAEPGAGEEQEAEGDSPTISEWLTELNESENEVADSSDADGGEVSAVPDGVVEESAEQASPPEWLEELAAEAENAEQPSRKKTTDALESPPDWLEELREAGEGVGEAEEEDEVLAVAEVPSSDEESQDPENAIESETPALAEAAEGGSGDWVPERELRNEGFDEIPLASSEDSSSTDEPQPLRSKQEESIKAEKSLENARQALEELDLQRAAKHYEAAIASRKVTNSVIEDLEAALERFPDKVVLLQALGDAYMRADRLKEALACYTKAEDLI